jgi:hypothetical protein
MEALDLRTEHQADYRVVRLTGHPEDLGRHQAGYLRPAPPPFKPWPWETDQRFLGSCAAIVGDIAPWLVPELRAFAEYTGIPLAQGLFIRGGEQRHGCSAVVWRASNGHVMAGRTYDFYVRMRTRHLLITRPVDGAEHLGMNGGLVGGRYDGVNEHGVFIALHKVMTNRPERTEPGVPYHLIPRIVLQCCTTAADAAVLIEHIPHLASFNYTVADPSGTMIALECYPGVPVRRREEERVLAVTNHYTDPALRPMQGKRSIESSEARKARLEETGGQGDPWKITACAVADHEGGVCSHREFGATLWAGVFDLTARRVAYSFGAPCRNDLVPYSFPGDDQ